MKVYSDPTEFLSLKRAAANRSQKKKAVAEYKLCETLCEIEREFVDSLFEHEESYQFLYACFHNKWLKQVRHIKRVTNCEYVEIKEDYFKQKYAPIEKSAYSSFS